MNKAEFINLVAEDTGLSKADAERALNAVLGGIKKVLVKGGQVAFVGFGTFKTSKRSARVGRNPKTGAELKIPARVVPAFQAGKALKEAVDGDTKK